MDQQDLLTAEQGQSLVRLARHALDTTIHGPRSRPRLQPAAGPRLDEKGATFVTLTIGGALRGCIGTPTACWSLAKDVQENAVRAATLDPRFPPITPADLEHIRIEVSVLTPPHPLQCPPDNRSEHIVGKGLLLTSGHRRGLLLPQVWEKIPEPIEFLQILCQKAGLPTEAWRWPSTELHTFQVQAFHEE